MTFAGVPDSCLQAVQEWGGTSCMHRELSLYQVISHLHSHEEIGRDFKFSCNITHVFS